MSFWKYLKGKEKVKYILFAAVGSIIAVASLLLVVLGYFKVWLGVMIVFAAAVPVLSKGLRLKIKAYERAPSKELSEKDRKQWEQAKKLTASAKRTSGERKFVRRAFFICLIFAVLMLLFMFLAYSKEMRILLEFL